MKIRIALTSCFAMGLLAAIVSRAADEPSPAKVANVSFPADGKIDFVKHVQPILQTSCAECHNAENKKGRLRLDAKQMMARGGQSGSVIAPGNAQGSTL